jgi:hypothetical protein
MNIGVAQSYTKHARLIRIFCISLAFDLRKTVEHGYVRWIGSYSIPVTQPQGEASSGTVWSHTDS